MELKEFYERLESFVAVDPSKLSDEELLESLLPTIDCIDSQTLQGLINREGLKDVRSLFELKHKIRDIKRQLIANRDSFQNLVIQRIREAEAGFDALYDPLDDNIYLSAIEHFKKEAKEELCELYAKQLEGIDNDEREEIERRIHSLELTIVEYEEDEHQVYAHQPQYPFEEIERLEHAESSYNQLLELTVEANQAIKEFLEDEPSIHLLAKLKEDFLFADIVDVLFGLFHDEMFRPGVTKPMVLLALNCQESPLKLVNDRAQAAAAVVIDSIARHYREDSSDLLEWEERVLSYWGLTAKSYSTHKDDADENEQEDDWVLGKKWRERITFFRQYLMDLNVFKHRHDIKVDVSPE